jgi:hypothetical protein
MERRSVTCSSKPRRELVSISPQATEARLCDVKRTTARERLMPFSAIDTHAHRLSLARELGATHAINHVDHTDVVTEMRKITGVGVRHSIETTAIPSVFSRGSPWPNAVRHLCSPRERTAWCRSVVRDAGYPKRAHSGRCNPRLERSGGYPTKTG